jgi:Trp operon repressor
MANKNKMLLSKSHYHEMADRLHMMTDILDTHLLQHPVAKLDKEISENIEKAVDLLCEAYQQAGSKL